MVEEVMGAGRVVLPVPGGEGHPSHTTQHAWWWHPQPPRTFPILWTFSLKKRKEEEEDQTSDLLPALPSILPPLLWDLPVARLGRQT